MAERRQRNSAMPCRFFIIGQCVLGSSCRFSHDRSASSSYTCRFYLSGNCAFGSNCRYSHSPTSPHGAKERNRQPADFASHPRSSLRVDAPEFVPTSHAQPSSSNFDQLGKLCNEFTRLGKCSSGESCHDVHGDKCEFCSQHCLYPGHETSNALHRRICVEEHEKEMQVAFTIARSSVMQCGICMEVVMDKPGEKSSQFGILSNCRHCFCLDCIRTWRSLDDAESRNTRACPECRVVSNFIIPSPFWVEDEDERKVLISEFRSTMRKRPCRYHDAQRNRECPFGNQCFYLHSNPDGTVVEGDSPHTVRRRIRRNTRNRRRLMRRSSNNSNFIRFGTIVLEDDGRISPLYTSTGLDSSSLEDYIGDLDIFSLSSPFSSYTSFLL